MHPWDTEDDRTLQCIIKFYFVSTEQVILFLMRISLSKNDGNTK